MSIFSKMSRGIEKKMMYSTPADSSGERHLLARQQRDMSCGIACVAMVVARVRGVRIEESALRSYSKCFYQGPGTDTTGYDKGEGTEIHNMAIMLKKMCVPVKTDAGGRAINNGKRAGPGKPAIALVHWRTETGAGGGGGHFVVVDSMDDKGNAVICDPWYGLTECDISSGKYTAAKGATGDFSKHWIFTD